MPLARQLAVAMAALGAIALGACSRDEATTTVVAEASPLDSADQVAFGTRTLVTDAGLLRAEVFADTALFLDQNTRILMYVVNGSFFDAQGAKNATLVADRGTYRSTTGNLEAWGNVVVTGVDGRVLKSSMLRFDARENQILSDSFFVMTEPDGREVRGIGFRADPNLDVIRVLRLEEGRGGAVRLEQEAPRERATKVIPR